MDKYTLNPAVPGALDNMVIGALKPVHGSFSGISQVHADGTVSMVGRVRPFTVTAGAFRNFAMQEGDVLTVTGAAGTSGTVQRLDANDGPIGAPIAIGVGVLAPIGPFSGTQKILITCTAGSIDATVGDAVLGSAQNVTNPSGTTVVGQAGPDGRLTAAHYDLRPAFLHRPGSGSVGNASNVQTNTSALVTASQVPYHAVRVSYLHLGGNGPVTSFKMLLASSDDIGSRDFTDNTAANFRKCQVPKRGGVTYNNLAPDGSPGWKLVTWGGAETLDIPDPGGILQKETLTFSGAATGTSITVAGVVVTLVVGDTAATVAGKVAAALGAVTATYSSAVANGAVVTVVYKVPGRFPGISGATQAGVTWAGAVTLFGEIKIASVSSDIIAEVGVLDVANGVYPLLMRWMYGTASWSYVNAQVGVLSGADFKTEFPSLVYIPMNKSGDNVTSPSTWSESNNPNISTNTINVQIEFFTDRGVLSVSMVMDSRGQVSTETPGNIYRCLENYLHNALLAVGEKPSIVRHSISGFQSYNYQPRSLVDYVSETPSKWAVYLVYSPNDGSPTDAVLTHAKARALQYVEQARKKGTRILLIHAFPCGVIGAPVYSAPKMAALAELKVFCTNLGDVVFDGLGIYGNSDGTWKVEYGFDNNHMLNTGYQDCAARLAAILHEK